jgi:hypothetical protein
MKRLLFLFLGSFFLSYGSYANDINISASVLQSFNRSFKNATEVKWSSVKDYYKAEFIFNEQHASAFFDFEGNLVAITRHILSTLLPISLQAELKKDFEEYWISDLFELNNDQGISYFITLEKPNVTVVLKSNSSNGWSYYNKINK